jgi:hypothetical protein
MSAALCGLLKWRNIGRAIQSTSLEAMPESGNKSEQQHTTIKNISLFLSFCPCLSPSLCLSLSLSLSLSLRLSVSLSLSLFVCLSIWCYPQIKATTAPVQVGQLPLSITGSLTTVQASFCAREQPGETETLPRPRNNGNRKQCDGADQ